MIFHPRPRPAPGRLGDQCRCAAGAGLFAVRLLRHWNPASGSERQIALERQTYLVTTGVGLVLLIQCVALLLFVYNAERMSVLFTGAMCATGTLNVNAYGFPAR
jgi:hypothetical protein